MPLAVGLYRTAVALVAVAGIAMEVARSESPHPFVYFTIQSNCVLAVCFAFAAWSAWRGRAGLPGGLKGAATLYILITGLVFNFVLSDGPTQVPPAGAGELVGRPWWAVDSSDLLHTVAPAAAALDFALFDRHRRLRWYYAPAWLVYPLAYVVFTTLRGALFPTAGYPYFFIDVSLLGYSGLVRSMLLYGTAFLVLGLVLVAADRLLGMPASERVLSRLRGDRPARGPAPVPVGESTGARVR
ncbi:Pr6Pr family membrane protein [Streptomonospora wellingtoniae]|uniref:Pr6Pr family membrane protein n=1 Tax=Streptomonospora wellingtoniae TaxID=3075544 RepID=A0ABU2L192_9ACTN|nr:Pr6Pr family membrane protein [Streptomonospora sp. DSM 45055]MDT0305305.1 Pr6Pr family membrane protein [Streptomonospora sp. DSM 45055]